MSKIFCIVGKSCSGKDTLYKAILRERMPNLHAVVPYTTRPRRLDEVDGLNYFFVDDIQMQLYEKSNQIVEKREYNTMQGVWSYFTLKFSLDEKKDYLLITTLEGARSLIRHYGSHVVNLIYLYVDDRIRLLRCIEREALQEKPDYSEVCRRYIADQQDFSPSQLSQFEHIHQIDTHLSIDECIKDWKDIYDHKSCPLNI